MARPSTQPFYEYVLRRKEDGYYSSRKFSTECDT